MTKEIISWMGGVRPDGRRSRLIGKNEYKVNVVNGFVTLVCGSRTDKSIAFLDNETATNAANDILEAVERNTENGYDGSRFFEVWNSR